MTSILLVFTRNSVNLQQPIQMQLYKNQEKISEFFTLFLKSS